MFTGNAGSSGVEVVVVGGHVASLTWSLDPVTDLQLTFAFLLILSTIFPTPQVI